MTREEFDACMLLVFHHKGGLDPPSLYKRYRSVTAYDMEVEVAAYDRIFIKYDLDSPDETRWAHTTTIPTFAQAWEFITAFINEHPDK